MNHSPRGARLLASFVVALLVILLAPGYAPSCAAAAANGAATQTATTESGAADIRAKGKPLPDQYGMAVEYGYTYDPQEQISFLLARIFASYDYGSLWHQDRPAALRFKVEGAAGSTLTPGNDLIVSANMLALYYLGSLDNRTLRPYIEAGIGAIYTQFRVKGQGLHYNFNPLLGVGCELLQPSGKNPFVALRLHHISNANLFQENRGVNSVELQLGRFF